MHFAQQLPAAAWASKKPHEETYEAIATGPDEDDEAQGSIANMSRLPESSMEETLRRLQSLRTVRQAIDSPYCKTPQLIVEGIRQEINNLQNHVQRVVAARAENLKYCTASKDLPESEKQRLRELTVLEDQDALLLDGLEIGDSLAKLKEELSSLTERPEYNALVNLMHSDPSGKRLDDVKRAALREELAKKVSSEAKSSGESESNLIEVYVPRICRKGVGDILSAYSKLEERVSEIEALVGIHEANAIQFPYSDISSALTSITDKVLNLDPKRMELVNQRAHELGLQLEEVVKKKNRVFGMSETTNDTKIAALYELASRWRFTAETIPQVVQKMKFLSVVVNECAGLESRVERMESEMNRLREMVERSEKLVGMLCDRVDEHIKLLTNLAAKL